MKYLKAFVEDVKDSGSIRVVASSESVDRDGEILKIDGWTLEEFQKNPVLLWSHDARQLPIGKVSSIRVEGDKLIADTVFAAQESEFAAEVERLVRGGFINTVSVGFMPLEFNQNGETIKQELLELSYVNVPSNPQARVSREYKSFQKTLEDIESKDKSEENDKKQEQEKDSKRAIESKEGRTISEKNRTIMRSAISAMEQARDALDELLESTEPPEKNKGGGTQSRAEKKSNKILKALRVVDKAAEAAIHIAKGGDTK